jgi:hypothetical protein
MTMRASSCELLIDQPNRVTQKDGCCADNEKPLDTVGSAEGFYL